MLYFTLEHAGYMISFGQQIKYKRVHVMQSSMYLYNNNNDRVTHIKYLSFSN